VIVIDFVSPLPASLLSVGLLELLSSGLTVVLAVTASRRAAMVGYCVPLFLTSVSSRIVHRYDSASRFLVFQKNKHNRMWLLDFDNGM